MSKITRQEEPPVGTKVAHTMIMIKALFTTFLLLLLTPLTLLADVDLTKMSQTELIEFLHREGTRIESIDTGHRGSDAAKIDQAWKDLRDRVAKDGDVKKLRKLYSKVHPDNMANLSETHTKQAADAFRTLQNIVKGSTPFKSYGTFDNFQIGEKFFTFKHAKSAVYGYPKEISKFMIANVIIMYAQCYGSNGLTGGQTMYEARNLDPVCMQNLADLFTSPIFYGAFGAFMLGSRYGTPAALNAFQFIRNRPKGSRMTAQSARFWSMQFGMAFGFFADQMVHRLYESKELRQCAASMVKFGQTGKDTVDVAAMESGADQAELTILNDKDRHCARAFRELGSRQSRTFFSSSLLSLGASATLGGVISNKIITKSAIGGKIVGEKAWNIIQQKITSGRALWGFRAAGKGIVRFGMMTAGITHMTVFLGLSYILSPVIEKTWKVTRHTFDFKKQSFDLKRQFDDYAAGKESGEVTCPVSYFTGRALEESGQCSQLGPITSLRTYHDFQKAWRQDKLMQKYLTGYQGWQKKWNEFHSVYMATLNTYQTLAQVREYKATGKILSQEGSIVDINSDITVLLNEQAEATGTTSEVLYQKIVNSENDESIQLNEEEEWIRIMLSIEDSVASGYQDIAEDETFYVLKPLGDSENPDVLNLTSVVVDPTEILQRVKAALKVSRTNALTQLSLPDQDFYLEINKIRQKHKDGTIRLGGRFADLSQSRQQRAYNRFLGLAKKITEFESKVWTGNSFEEQWFARGLKEQSTLLQGQRLDFAKAREMIFSEDENQISIGLTILRKLSQIQPQTSYKKDVAIALDGFYPKPRYSLMIRGLENNYAQMAGHEKERANEYYSVAEASGSFTFDTSFEDESAKHYQEYLASMADSQAKPFWLKSRGPFTISDLYDHVLTQGLCGSTKESSGLFTNNEGRALEFHPPVLLKESDICLRAGSLHTWGSAKGMSVKNSLFVDEQDQVYKGLFDFAVQSNNLPDYMENEATFMEWWNNSVINEVASIVTQMARRYHGMTSDQLMPLFNRNQDDLKMALAGLQVLSFDGWLSQLPEKNYIYDLVGSHFSKKLEHSNFKQSNNLNEAWANEFGFLANILAVQLEKQYNDGSSIQNTQTGAGVFMPEAISIASVRPRNATQQIIQELKTQFLVIVNYWDSPTEEIFSNALNDFDTQGKAIAQFYFPGDAEAFEHMQSYLSAEESELFSKDSGESPTLNRLVKDTKVAAVILSQLYDIVEEIKDVRRRKNASEFNFSLATQQ